MDIIFEDFIYSRVCDYLNINDNKELSLVNKKVYNNVLNKKIRRFHIFKRSSELITALMRKYTCKIRFVNFYFRNEEKINSKKMNALIYYRYYEKKHINSWYNIEIPWKKKIIDKYKKNITTSPSRIDLYLLIKMMDIKEVAAIGW